VAYLWVVFAAFVLWDLFRREWTRTSLTVLMVTAAFTSLVYAVGWRPAVIGEWDRVLVRNPFRTASIPWNAVEDIDVTDALRIHTRLTIVRAWAVDRGGAASNTFRGVTARGGLTGRSIGRGDFGGNPRSSGPDVEQRAMAAMARRGPAETALQTLTERWRQRRGQTRGVAVIRWAWPTIALIVGTVGGSIALMLTA
jgi:hypothetical protein